MAQETKSLKDLPILDSHHERTVLRNATEARQQFFVLLSEVVADPSEVVLIEHKDLPGRGMRERKYLRCGQLSRLQVSGERVHTDLPVFRRDARNEWHLL